MPFPIIPVIIWSAMLGPAAGVALTDKDAAPDELKLKVVDQLIEGQIQKEDLNYTQYGMNRLLSGMKVKSSEIKARKDYFKMVLGHTFTGYGDIGDNIDGKYSDKNRYEAILVKDVDGEQKEYELVCDVMTTYKKSSVDSKTLELKADSVTDIKLDNCNIENLSSEVKARVVLDYTYDDKSIDDSERSAIEKEIAKTNQVQKTKNRVITRQ